MGEMVPSALAQQMMTFLDCPCTYFSPVKDDEILQKAYKKALQQGKETGFTPVLVKVDDILFDCLLMNSDTENEADYDMAQVHRYRQTLLTTVLPDGASYLQNMIQSYQQELAKEDIDWAEILGEMKDGLSIDSFSCFWEYGADATAEVILAQIPTTNPWEIFAWLPMGNWNDCPDALQMMAVAKYWFTAFGAVPAALSHDELEFYMEKPVITEEDAQKLALEQYAFCPDRVEQCEEDGSVGKLADTLRQSNIWYFWWD